MENKELLQTRNKLDEIDRTLMSLLDKRADLVMVVGEIKLRENIPILNKAREDEIISKVHGFKNSEYVSHIYIKIIEESKKLEKEKWK